MIDKEMRERGDRLRAYCDAARGKPVKWGQDDCSTWALQWLVNETGKEVDWPAYSSREEAGAIIDSAGGLAGVWDRMARRMGVDEFHGLSGFPIVPPPIGSVGIIQTGYHGQVGCIFADGLVACVRLDVPNERPDASGVRLIGVRPKHVIKVWSF